MRSIVFQGETAQRADGEQMPKIQIRHEPDGELIAEGRVGLFGITPFEGNYYISKKCLRTEGFRTNWIPGFCPYKFIYVWLDFFDREGRRDPMLGWRYVLPNLLFFFIAWRVAVPRQDPRISVQTVAD